MKIVARLVIIYLVVCLLTAFFVIPIARNEYLSTGRVDPLSGILIFGVGTVNRALYLITPEVIAIIEYVTGKDMLFSGDCRIKNLTENGYIYVGTTQNSKNLRQNLRHLRSTTPAGTVENTCPECVFISYDLILRVQDGKIEPILPPQSDMAIKDMRYIRTALLVRKLLKM